MRWTMRNLDTIAAATATHVLLVGAALLIAVAIALPLGIAVARRPTAQRLVLGTASILPLARAHPLAGEREHLRLECLQPGRAGGGEEGVGSGEGQGAAGQTAALCGLAPLGEAAGGGDAQQQPTPRRQRLAPVAERLGGGLQPLQGEAGGEQGGTREVGGQALVEVPGEGGAATIEGQRFRAEIKLLQWTWQGNVPGGQSPAEQPGAGAQIRAGPLRQNQRLVAQTLAIDSVAGHTGEPPGHPRCRAASGS